MGEMDGVPDTERREALAALQSAVGKSETALAHMTEKGASTSLVAKRLHALRVGLAMLESVWLERPCRYTGEDLEAARGILAGLLPSVEAIYAQSKPGTPQRTLLERRIRALNLALEAIDGRTR